MTRQPLVAGLDDGETAAIALAESLAADILLIDDREAYRLAQQKGLRLTGTLGLLDLAAERGVIDFSQAILALKRTTFRRPDVLLNALLAKHKDKEIVSGTPWPRCVETSGSRCHYD